MNAETKIGAIVRALALVVLLGTIAMWSSNAAAQAPDPMFVASMGAEDALVTVIEYASLASVDTAEFHRSVFQDFKNIYVNTGLVRYEFRDLTNNDTAASAAVLARCAGQDRYFDFLRSLLFSQDSWLRSADPLFSLYVFAEMGGMSEFVFTDCLANEELVKSIVTAAATAREEFGIDTSPSFIINGTMYAGYRSFEDLQAIIDPLIVAASASNPFVEEESNPFVEEEIDPGDPGGGLALPMILGILLAGIFAGTYFLRKSKSSDV